MIDPAILETVSVPLALQDAMPVALSAVGMVLLARAVGQRTDTRFGRAATVGAVLIGLGGACKVGWKIGAAAFEVDLFGLTDWLFPLLAGGFVIMSLAVAAVRKGSQPHSFQPKALIVPGVMAILSFLALSFVDLEWALRYAMVIAIVGSFALSWMLIRIAAANGDRLAAILVEVNVLATLGLAWMASAGEQTLGTQWVEQAINTMSQGIFLMAVLRLAPMSVSWSRHEPALPALEPAVKA